MRVLEWRSQDKGETAYGQDISADASRRSVAGRVIPLGLSAGAIAKASGIPRTRIERIANEQSPITADTALRLGKALGTSDQLWLTLQNEFDMRAATIRIGKDLEKISPVAAGAA